MKILAGSWFLNNARSYETIPAYCGEKGRGGNLAKIKCDALEYFLEDTLSRNRRGIPDCPLCSIVQISQLTINKSYALRSDDDGGGFWHFPVSETTTRDTLTSFGA